MNYRNDEYYGNRFIDTIKNDFKKTENSFKTSIEIITKKIIDEYKMINYENYELINGANLLKLIDNLSEKIILPKKEKNISIIDLFEKIIYGNTPLFSGCKKAFENSF